MELLLNSPPWLQILFTIAALIGLYVMYKFKWLVMIIGVGAIALWKQTRESK